MYDPYLECQAVFEEKIIVKGITLSKLERQLLRYDIFYGCMVTWLEDITERLPVQKKMIQRDICDLTDARLICMTRIGYEIYFINQDHCFVQQFCWEGLREDFGVRRKDGKLDPF